MRNIHRLVFLCFFVAACGGAVDTSMPDAGSGSDIDAAPPPPPPPGCTVGESCDFGSVQGICDGDSCSACSSDAACQSVYGASYACVDGACELPPPPPPECVTDNDCDTGKVCSNGSCVAQSGCVVGGDIECCPGSNTCGSGNTCQAHQCVPTSSGCTSPATATYYVNPSYSGPSTGSQACPFKTLHGAFNEIRNDAFTADSEVRIVDGAHIDATSEGGADKFPLVLPSSTYVHTVDNAAANAVITAPANTTAFEVKYAVQPGATAGYNVRLSQLEIKQASAGTAGTAVDTTAGSAATPVHLDHLNIHNFFNGIHVEGGYTLIAWGVSSHGNAQAGLYVGGGRADVTVGSMADARTHFDNNEFGIWETDDAASALDITGAIGATDGFETVTASSNASQGIHVGSPNVNNSLLHVGLISNAGSALVIFGGAKVKVRHLNIESSGSSGVRILDNDIVASLAGIDLGTVGDPGKNEIQSSTDSHICVSTTPDGTALSAEGNTYGNLDCSTTAGTVNSWSTCAGHGRGVNDTAGPGRIDVAGCTIVPQ